MMRRHAALFVATVALLLSRAPAGAQTPAKLTTAVIDVQRILAQSVEGKKEMARLKKIEDEKAQTLAAIEADVNKLRQKLSDLGFSIADDERTKLQREIEDKVISGERFRKDSLRDIKTKYEEVLSAFEKRIGPIVEQLGTDRGILLILHRDNPIIAWADPVLDITPEVIDRFDKASAAGVAGAKK